MQITGIYIPKMHSVHYIVSELYKKNNVLYRGYEVLKIISPQRPLCYHH